MISCEICNGIFSTKHSLSSHRSKYHRESHVDKLGSESDASKLDEGQSDNDSQSSNTGVERQSSNESQSSKTAEEMPSDSQNDDQGSGESGNDYRNEDQSDNSEKSDNESKNQPVIKQTIKRKLPIKLKHCKRTRQERNSRSKLFTEEDKHIKLLTSINSKLKREHENFKLLDAFVLKNEVCSKLATDHFGGEAEMEKNLPNEELWLVKAICKSDLETVRKIMFENHELIKELLARTV